MSSPLPRTAAASILPELPFPPVRAPAPATLPVAPKLPRRGRGELATIAKQREGSASESRIDLPEAGRVSAGCGSLAPGSSP